MPRKILPTINFDDAEGEVIYTRAALKADPDAEDLTTMTEEWLGMIDGARAKDRLSRQAIADTDAKRAVANARLDQTCRSVSDDLYLSVGKDRQSTTWLQFFKNGIQSFVRQALAKQVNTVESWLRGSTHPVIEKHRAPLTLWCQKASQALIDTQGTALVRGEAKLAQEEMAENLTRERDGLHSVLVQRAQERGLPREWPSVFFRAHSSRSSVKEIEEETTSETSET